jgi:hypothetical protein
LAGWDGGRPFSSWSVGESILKSWVKHERALGVCQARPVDGCGDESLVGGEWRLTRVAGDRYDGHTGIKKTDNYGYGVGGQGNAGKYMG